METEQPNVFLQLLPLIVLSIPIGLMAKSLAVEKGRNVAKWTVLGFIPFINFFAMYYFMGAANLRLERKIDALLKNKVEQPLP